VSVDIPEIVEAVCRHFRVTTQALYGRSRRADIALPRQIAMYLARTETNASLPQIGEALGGRDHTTVLYACDKISDLAESDPDIRRDLMAIREMLYRKGG
jgi:chromosomal replication initiator protein